jgi:hypothetical protein
MPVVQNGGAPPLVGGPESVSAGGATGQASAGGGTTPGIQTELKQLPQSSQTGVVAVSLPPETATAGAGFVFALPGEVVEQITTEVRVNLADGAPLPGWLRFVPERVNLWPPQYRTALSRYRSVWLQERGSG